MTTTRMRSALFVPANRPERIPKALASGADAVIVDLEDAVAEADKDRARQALADYLSTHPDACASIWVRANDASTPWCENDLAMCRQHAIAGIVVPKAQADTMSLFVDTGKPLLALIETAKGLQDITRIASLAEVKRLTFGVIDLMLDLGTDDASPAARMLLDYTRMQVLVASRAHGLLPPLDTVFADFADTDGLNTRAQFAQGMGFAGMLCIHPRQIECVHAVYGVSQQASEWARRVLAHVESTGEYTFQLDGKMVDKPVIERARRLLQQSASEKQA